MEQNENICNIPFSQVLFQVALMILKFIEAPLLVCNDEAEAISVLNDFLANLGNKAAQESKILDEETVKVCPLETVVGEKMCPR